MTTGIEWTEETWNPVRGCTRISSGCGGPNHEGGCYAERLASSARLRRAYHDFAQNGRWTGKVALIPEKLDDPLEWKRPRMIFVNSMSDLFHEYLSDDDIANLFDTMERADWHTYQILSKRSARLPDFINRRYRHGAPAHIWLGVSVENAEVKFRIGDLQNTNARVRFLSIESLIEAVGKLHLTGIHWVIVGGESGPRHRLMKLDWATDVRDQCVAQGVAFFFKQWGGRTPKSGGCLLEGREWKQYPDHQQL
jgi:protein gp37